MIFNIKMHLLLIILTIVSNFYAQNYPPAPEIWSAPKVIEEIRDFFPNSEVRTVSVTADGKKLFIFLASIAYLEKTDTGWTEPAFLNDNVNSALAGWPCISPNGKRLFYSRFVGGWYLYYSDWDSSANDWSVPINCGPGVNTLEVTLCAAPDDSTIIYGREGQSFISRWDSVNNIWGVGHGFPNDDDLFVSERGLFVSKDFEKVYNDLGRADTLRDGSFLVNEDITVLYKSPTYYWPPKILNFCLTADTLYNQGLYDGKTEGSPTLTGDGKTMYFMADYTGRALIYETHMLIDENGDPVTNVSSENFEIPNRVELFSPYPNPFNLNTIIRYKLNTGTNIHLSVFDILGKEISVLENGYKKAGEYRTILNGSNLSSGLYLIALKTNTALIVKKTILLK